MTPFQEQLELRFRELPLGSPLDTVRKKAWEQFQTVGLPEKKQEVWRSIKLRKLYEKSPVPAPQSVMTKESLQEWVLPGFEKCCLVFLNGRLNLELSSLEAVKGALVVSPLEKAIKSYGGFLNHSWMQAIKDESDPFAVLNSALGTEGAFLYLPPKTVLDTPIQILSVLDTDLPALTQVSLHMFAGKHARASLISTPVVLNREGVDNISFTFTIDENADVSLDQLNHRMPKNHWHLETVRATLKRDSRFNCIHLTNGSETVRTDYKAVLTGENAEANLYGLWMLKENREAHTNVLIDHQAPNCRSNQLFKGVLDDVSRSSFEGKIFVHQAAQKTDAFQLNNHLLLSQNAHAFSKPNLEIFADDVKASHGATVGQLDEEQLFYLKSRGFSQEMAQTMMVRGFYLEMTERLQDARVKEYVLKEITQGW